MNIDDNKNLDEFIECDELCLGYDSSSDKEEENEGEDPLLQGKFTLKDGKLDNFVWADRSSITDYQYFGDVLVFDTTYQKNKYNRPLVVFLGTNHHGQTCIFGCGLLSDEKRETYVLVLNMFMEIMGNKQPIAVVIDGDLAMREAIKEVLPNAAHHLCAWHLYQFERRWHNLISEYGLFENEWLQKTYKIKEMWASSYLNDKFFGEIRTTSQCEGIHFLIKNYISKKCYLLELIHNFNEALTQYWKNELLSDFKSLFTTPVLTTCLQDIEKQVADIFTRSMFKEVRCEIEEAGKLNVVTQSVSNNEVKVRINKYRQPGRECEVQYDKATKKFACDCRLFESRGIPCCHIFCTMRHDHIDIIPDTLVCTRYGALATLCFTLCESASKNRDDFMEIRDDIFGLIQKLKKRRDPDSNVLSNACMVGDPTIVKTKESPRQNRLAVKSRKCSHCTRHGHTIRRCPKLYSRDILHTGHHQSSDELNDVKSYSEEETNHQSNHENNVQSVDHRYFSDNGTNKLATQKNKNGVKATEDTRVNDTSLKSKKYKRRCSNIHNAYKSGQPNNHDTGKTCQPNPIDPLKLQNQHLNGLPVYPTFPEFSIPSYHPYNGTLLYQSYSPYYYNVANGNLFWNGEVMYIEDMLQDDSFYDLETTVRPKISRFADPKHIETGEQKIGSNDCGIWVATGMKDCAKNDNYSIKPKVKKNDALGYGYAFWATATLFEVIPIRPLPVLKGYAFLHQGLRFWRLGIGYAFQVMLSKTKSYAFQLSFFRIGYAFQRYCITCKE
ncbi:hypothetical protein AHAS_Ahas18G0202100 [Arachis hypogaea]